jgi:heterodisulfide reductase subunit A
MDLQQEDTVAARQIEKAVADTGIAYIRSRPAAVHGRPGGGLDVTFEDTLSGTIESSDFDLVVLSTGLIPSEGTLLSADQFGVNSDDYGFVAVSVATPGRTSVPFVYAAGGATGPVDLVEAGMSGMAAAAAVLEDMPPSWRGDPPRVIIAGDEPLASTADYMAKAMGADTVMIMGGPGRGLQRLEGQPGEFHACLGGCGTEMAMTLSGDLMIAAVDPRRGGTSSIPGSLSFAKAWKGIDTMGRGSSVLVMGDDSEALRLASGILEREGDSRVDILYREMAIAEAGMQELQFDLASIGVGFHRYSPGTIRVREGEDGTTVTFVDELSPELGELYITTDNVVAPQVTPEADLVWPWFLSRFAPEGVPSALRLNVLPVETPRRGVYTTTPASGAGTASSMGGAAAAALALADFARGFPILDEIAEVDEDKCAACLNCIRVCPHDAIVFDEEARAAVILKRACQDCGVCASICPAQAITMIPGEGGEPDV